ncbi:MAG TPA: pilus assembly protein TadG-related protein [Anaerolineae bacterium]|nr:pilus assembly protein TadG-related protein [Anaerolineae bacterium]
MTRYRRQSGQILVIVAVVIFALVALTAVIIDGGSLYLNRRLAQTAADAGAMAGAHKKCVDDGTLAEIQAAVQQFAVVENGATAVESVEIDEDGQVVVQTRVESPSFFASILGFDSNISRAEAAAGCFLPSTMVNLLPVAWTCRETVGGGDPGTGCDPDAIPHSIPWTMFQPLLDLDIFGNGGAIVLDPGDGELYNSYRDSWPPDEKEAYLVMDKAVDTEVDCASPFGTGNIDCDLNNDGTIDVTGSDGRGWLALAGTGASDLVDLMLHGYPEPVITPQWFPGQPGAALTVFINAHDIEGNVVMVPIFDEICGSTTEDDLRTACAQKFHEGDLVRASSGSSDWYRVAGFAPFVVTCVSKGTSEQCPAKTYAGLVGPSYQSVATIEGYFISGYVGGSGICPGCMDLGVYIVSLTK